MAIILGKSTDHHHKALQYKYFKASCLTSNQPFSPCKNSGGDSSPPEKQKLNYFIYA